MKFLKKVSSFLCNRQQYHITYAAKRLLSTAHQQSNHVEALNKQTCNTHATECSQYIQDFHHLRLAGPLTIDGTGLTLAHIYNIYHRPVTVQLNEASRSEVQRNREFFERLIKQGHVIYGVNTGYGGSANTRSQELRKVQQALLHHLNAGFGERLAPGLVRCTMCARANSLALARSAVRPEIIDSLLSLVNADILPEVPLRGSISASGDLMPTSYIASAMSGRTGIQVTVGSYNERITAPEALAQAGINPVTFEAKEALAVINASSVSACLAAKTLFDANFLAVFTQIITAMGVEALRGRAESFHAFVADSLPHPGHIETSRNISSLLEGSNFARMRLEVDVNEIPERNVLCEGELKQDRYPLRTAAQWLAPVLETLRASNRRVTTELNSANDNPLVDHDNQAVLHCGNFQGTSITVAMDQTRQAVQLCGKLLFAQLSEHINANYNQNLPANLAGADPSVDFGFKGVDVSMAAYCSELDSLAAPISAHVLSAEMHNQAVNSMALVSARKTEQAVEILYMMVACSLRALVQSIELRWLESKIQDRISHVYSKHNVDCQAIPVSAVPPAFKFYFNPVHTATSLLQIVKTPVDTESFIDDVTNEINQLKRYSATEEMTQDVQTNLGQGTSKIYKFIKTDLKIPFYNGDNFLDTEIESIFNSLKSREFDSAIVDLFSLDSTK